MAQLEKYWLKKDQGQIILVKEGQPAMCAKIPRIAVPDNLKGMAILDFPCNTRCPFFAKAELGDNLNPGKTLPGVALYCQDKARAIYVSDEPEPERPKLNLVK
jgi:hypothetical protein